MKPRSSQRGPRCPLPNGRLLALTERDTEALTFIGVMRLVTAAQILRADIGFTSANYTTKRLRALAQAGLIDVVLVHAREPNLYRLTKAGRAVVRARRPETAEHVRPCGVVDVGGLGHQLALVDARLYCAALGRRRRAPLTRWSTGAGEAAARLGLPDLRLVPDGLAEYAVPGGQVVVSVEVDAGTENTRTLRRKFAKYVRAAAETPLDALWLVVAAGSRRAETIQRLLTEAGLLDWSRVMSRAYVNVRPVQELPLRGRPGHGVEP